MQSLYRMRFANPIVSSKHNSFADPAWFDDAKKFDEPNNIRNGALKNLTAPIRAGHAHFEIADLKYGKYAIKFFHDEDRSNKFYKNILGAPKVEYGFSNIARGLMAPAKYKQAEFSFDYTNSNLELKAAK